MSSVLRAIWENTYGLLVDDGQLALGALVALALTWVVANFGGETVHEDAGWLLVVLVVALLVANTYRAGRRARARAAR